MGRKQTLWMFGFVHLISFYSVSGKPHNSSMKASNPRSEFSSIDHADRNLQTKKRLRTRRRMTSGTSIHNTALVLLEIDDSGAEGYRDVLFEASSHYHLKFCGIDCEKRRKWHKNSKWRQGCRTMVGGYVMGMCPGKAYYTGSSWVPCLSMVSFRNPIDRVLSAFISCQKNPKSDKCASQYLDSNVIGYRKFAEHHKNYVMLKLAQDRDNILGPEHPEACANPAGCLKHTPCWYKHNQHVELDGTAHALFNKALSRLAELDVVLIYERYAESLKLFECKTKLSTIGIKEFRRAIAHPNAGQSGYPTYSTSPLAKKTDALSTLEMEKFVRWRELMRNDIEIQSLLAREFSLYDAAMDLFEKQLLQCGIQRNGSKITMDQSSVRSGSLIADAMERKSESKFAVNLANEKVRAEAEMVVNGLIQDHHIKSSQRMASKYEGGDGISNPALESSRHQFGRIEMVDNRKRRGGLSRVHQERFKMP